MEWISVKDKLPKDGQDVLCWNGKRVLFSQFQIDSDLEFAIGCFMVQKYHSNGDRTLVTSWADISFWCSLPEPPKI